MINIAILASGSGSNFETLVRAVHRGFIKARIKLLVTDVENAYVRTRARRLGVNDIYVNPKDFANRIDFDNEIAVLLKKENIDLVVLAGFMRILSAGFVRKFKNNILNIHPALLPAFPGVDSIKRAYAYGVKLTGVTVHLVDEKVDHGPIIMQSVVPIKKTMNVESLERAVHALEHKLYPLAVKLFVEGKITVEGRNAKVI